MRLLLGSIFSLFLLPALAASPDARRAGAIATRRGPAAASRAAIQSRATVKTRQVGTRQAAAPETARDAANKPRTVQARAGATTTPLFGAGQTRVAAAGSTESCKAQYLSCMDNFCNVLDDNQGRCTCSSSITKYEKTEAALKKATEDLQDVATKIKYLGLSTDEVNSLFTQTAAEKAMSGQTDSSALKGDLDKIKKLLIDPTSNLNTNGGIGGSFDLSALSSLSDGLDMFSFMSNDSSITNQRGAALFETAKARCASILTDCQKQGVDKSMITSSYDLEIDKQCVAYERALTDSNDTMKTTLKNATTVLQQARLMVAQNKNKYDLKGCVNALDQCMQDDFVCGADYTRCLDATGQYIMNGAVIVGSAPTPAAVLANLDTMLVGKVGGIYGKTGKTTGMCASVMNQCQKYTYTNATTYKADNEVVQEYLKRTLSKIKTKQTDILAAYGASCRQDVMACLDKNKVNPTSADWRVTINACSAVITTCKSVLGDADGNIAFAIKMYESQHGANSIPPMCDTRGNIGIVSYDPDSCRITACKSGYTFHEDTDTRVTRFKDLDYTWCFINCPTDSTVESECPRTSAEKAQLIMNREHIDKCLIMDSGNAQQCRCADGFIANDAEKICQPAWANEFNDPANCSTAGTSNSGYYIDGNGYCKPKVFTVELHTRLSGLPSSIQCTWQDTFTQNGFARQFPNECRVPGWDPSNYGHPEFEVCRWHDMDSTQYFSERIANLFYLTDGTTTLSIPENGHVFRLKSQCMAFSDYSGYEDFF